MSVFQGPTSPRLLSSGDSKIVSPKPVRLQPILQSKMPDAAEPWTRSPRKAEMETSTAIWRIASTEVLAGKTTAGLISTGCVAIFADSIYHDLIVNCRI